MYSKYYAIVAILAGIAGNLVNGSNVSNKPDLFRCANIITKNSSEYTVAFPITGKQRDGGDIFLTFYIKAEKNAHIILSPTSQLTKRNQRAYEIVIGAHDKKQTVIRTTRGGPDLTSYSDTNNMLKPNEWREFWIRVDSNNGSIQVGKEKGSPAFMSWNVEPMSINHYGLASDESVVHWAFDCTNDRTEMNFTDCTNIMSNSYEYGTVFPITDQQRNGDDIFLTFYVKAAKDAHIILSSMPEPMQPYQQAYEIVIGSEGNSCSVIRKQRSGPFVMIHYEKILSPFVYRQFWIRVGSDGLIQVGKGRGGPAFLSWKDETPMPISYYGFSSWSDFVVNWALHCSDDNKNI